MRGALDAQKASHWIGKLWKTGQFVCDKLDGLNVLRYGFVYLLFPFFVGVHDKSVFDPTLKHQSALKKLFFKGKS